jgi:hypothetical protein
MDDESEIGFNLPLNAKLGIGTFSHIETKLLTLKINDQEVVNTATSGLRGEFITPRIGHKIKIHYLTPFLDQNDDTSYHILPKHLNFSFNDINEFSDKEIIDFLNDFYINKSVEEVTDIMASIRGDKAVQFVVKEKESGKTKKIPFSQISGGFRALTRFYFGLRREINETIRQSEQSKQEVFQIICIEEPENGFHASLQKKIPSILSNLIKSFQNIVFFVTTHSPFVIKASATEKEHKTFLFENGSSIDLARERKQKSKGYHGDNMLNVVSNILGAGFEDLSDTPKTFQKTKLVYCEGSGKDIKDSEIYKRIFFEEDVFFLSCGGMHEVIRAYNLAKGGVKFMLGQDCEIYALVDRSNSFKNIPIGPEDGDVIRKTGNLSPIFTESEKLQIESTDKAGHLKLLSRKEIENYLFDPIVINLLEKTEQVKIIQKDRNEVIDYKTGEVKDKFNLVDPNIRLKLADLISKHKNGVTKQIYEEIGACIGIPSQPKTINTEIKDESGVVEILLPRNSTLFKSGRTNLFIK